MQQLGLNCNTSREEREGEQPTACVAANHGALSELGSRKRRHLWGRGGEVCGWEEVVMGKRVKVVGDCYWVDCPLQTHTRTPLPLQPELSTQIEMDFEVLHHTESVSAVDFWSVRKSVRRKQLASLKSMTSRTKYLDHV